MLLANRVQVRCSLWLSEEWEFIQTLVPPCSSIKIPVSVTVALGFCNITAELFSEGLCSWSQENRSVDLKVDRAPWLRNPGFGCR